MVVIDDLTKYTADNVAPLAILFAMKKESLQKTATKVDAYFSKSHDKVRLCNNIMDQVRTYPENLLSAIPKTEYPLLIELVEETDPTKYAVRPIRKTAYALMTLGFVVTYEDEQNKKWHILMPTQLKQILRKDLPLFKSIYEQGRPIPKGKEARFMVMMNEAAKARAQAEQSSKESEGHTSTTNPTEV